MNRTVWSTTWNKSLVVEGCAGISTLAGCLTKVNPCEVTDLTHQFSPCGGSTENPESGTWIRCCPASHACKPLQSNGIDMESAALQNPASTRHSPQTSQQTCVFTSEVPFLSRRHLPQSGCQTEIFVRRARKSKFSRKYAGIN